MKKKRIGIITITELENYGNRLQNYALQTVLEKMGFEVETIHNYIIYKYRKSFKFKIKQIIKTVLYRNSAFFWCLVRQRRFDKFDSTYIKFADEYSTVDYIDDALKDRYDYFVAGSDQIWNPCFCFNFDFDFVNFASVDKRVAYAASFGVDYVPYEKKELFKDYLNGMRLISVREYAGKNIVKKLIGRDVPVLVDPTMLISADEWKKIEKKPKWLKNKKYILKYFLGNGDYEKDILEKNGYDNYEIVDIGKEKSKKFTVSPDEFIYLIRHSELIMTDSFHGTVFSIIMEKPFIHCFRAGENDDMNSRIHTLFEKFDINYDGGIFVEHIEDSAEYRKVLSEEQNKALEYLKQIDKE